MNKLNELLKHHKSPVFLLKNYEIIAFNEEFKKICPEILMNNNISDVFKIEKEELKSGSIRIRNKNKEEFKLYLSEFNKQIADFFVTISKYEEEVNESQISNTETNFFEFFDNVINPSIIVQFDGKIISTNKAAKTTAKFYKINLDEISNISEINIFGSNKNPLLNKNNYKKTNTTEFTINGTTIYLEYVIKPLVFKQKKALTIVFKDVTEIKNLIYSLETSRTKYRKILNGVFDGIILTDNLIIEFWNKAAEKITGYTKEEVIGKPLFSILKNKEGKENLISTEKINDIQKNINELSFTKKIQTKQGKEIIIETSVSTFIGPDGRPKSVDIFKDITEKYLTNIEVKKKEEELKKINSALKSFFSILAHDMRTPTIQMMGLSDLIIENVTRFSEEEMKKYLSMLQLSSKNSLELLDTIVEWGKTMTNKTPFKPKSFKINDVINKVLRVNQSKFESKEIHYEFEPNDVNVFADPNMVFPILNNLISNALKYSYKNSKIIVKTIEFDDSVQISIQDFGIGIKNIENIFEYNKKTIVLGTENEKGKGIGLMFTAELVKKNNGKIWVESESEKGSTFYLSLPKG